MGDPASKIRSGHEPIATLRSVGVAIARSTSGPGPYGAKTIADLALLVTPMAIATAITDATGMRFDELSITAQTVYRALKVQNDG